MKRAVRVASSGDRAAFAPQRPPSPAALAGAPSPAHRLDLPGSASPASLHPENWQRPEPVRRRLLRPIQSAALLLTATPRVAGLPVAGEPGRPGSALARWALLSPGLDPKPQFPDRARCARHAGRVCLCSLFSSHCLSADRRGPDHSALLSYSVLSPFASLSPPASPASLFSALPNPPLSLQQRLAP